MLRLSLGKDIRRTSNGSAGSDGPELILAAPSPLLLPLFKFYTVAIGVTGLASGVTGLASGVTGLASGVTGLALAFFLALVVVRTGCSVM